MRKILACLLSLLLAAPLGAHPHVFIDTGLELRFDGQGRLESLRITWVYDEFYSLLITEDMGLDADFDGRLTEAELAQLQGFDMNWIEGFNGDLEVYEGERLLALSGPLQTSASYADGRITTTHVRTVEGEVDRPSDLRILPYDMTYYTAYEVSLPVTFEGGTGCRHRVEQPDLDSGLQAMRRELERLDPELTPEEVGLPNIGKQLATTVRVICPVS